MLTTLIALSALVFTGMSVMQTGRQNAQQDNLTTQGQITDRYTAAVDQIGSAIPDVRMGGIYALERIMRDSPADQPTIVEVLSAFVRDHPPGGTKPMPTPAPMSLFSGALPLPADVAAALKVLGRRNVAHDDASVEDLRDTSFAAMDLTSLSMPGADLSGADLSGADLSGVNLSHADLTAANLTGANLGSANLSYADLTAANLLRAYLNDDHVVGANVRSFGMTGANLSGANLFGANLTGTSLCDDSISSKPDHIH